MLTRLFLTASVLMAGCDMTPEYVTVEDVGGGMQLGRYNVVCKGLEMEEEKTRGYTAGQLGGLDLPIAQECLCEHGVNAEAGTFDAAILAGLGSTNRDDLLSCFIDLLDAPNIQNKLELVVALARTNAPTARARLQEMVFDTTASADVRARAAGSLSGKGDADYQARLISVLTETGEGLGPVKAAVATILKTNESPEVAEALRTVATGEENPAALRGSALTSLYKLDSAANRELVCTASIEDPSPEVRIAAIKLLHGPRKNKKGVAELACLKKKLFTQEDDGKVRQATLEALKASPRDDVGKILCDAIPWWVRTYVEDKHPDKMEGANIIEAQNTRDFENTESCLRKAWNAGGYTCHGRQYVAAWASDYIYFNPRVPKCPGDL
ncbi:MAG: hypothetical protein VX519_02670 [Myxococcota bacterium]|nr:hypothetical protein [Myxococcota bacterium]